jgi:hypothetical protein
MEPNKERLRLWADALRSDRFPQTMNKLYRSAELGWKGGYCCLGVACVVAAENGLDLNLDEIFRGYTVLPQVVANWYGLPSAGPEDTVMLKTDGLAAVGAAGLNDKGVPFSKIAEYVDNTFNLREETV